jgi:hypothetical protein
MLHAVARMQSALSGLRQYSRHSVPQPFFTIGPDGASEFRHRLTMLMRLLSRGSASRVSALFYLAPPPTAFMAGVCFGESLTENTLIGFGFVVLGVLER